MATNFYPRLVLSGGTGGAIDEFDGDDLYDGDVFITVANGFAYFHYLDDDSAAAEQSPSVIAPDTNPGDKRAILAGMIMKQLMLENGDDDAFPAQFVLRKNRTAAVDDGIGIIYFQANDDDDNITSYGDIYATIADETDGSESLAISFRGYTGGTYATWLNFDGDDAEIRVNDGGDDLDFIVESDSITEAFQVTGSDGTILMQHPYSNGMTGQRELNINSSYEVGYDSSTINIKMNIVPLDGDATALIGALNPIQFNPKRKGPLGRVNSPQNRLVYGLIAEDVFDVNPLFTYLDKDNNPEGINWKQIFPFMIKEIQNLRTEVEALKGA
jgi:hypothetical protein